MAQPRPDPKRAEVEQLLGALAIAPDEQTAGRMEMRLRELWLQSGGPTTALLMTRGMRNLQSGAASEAVDDFDAVLALEPDLAEGYGRRAIARFESGDVAGALRDIEETVKREPRHFAAWQSLSRMAEAQGNLPGALLAWKKLLEIDPKTPNGDKRPAGSDPQG